MIQLILVRSVRSLRAISAWRCQVSSASLSTHAARPAQPPNTNKHKGVKPKTKDLDKIRNIGIIAHIDAGKTTTTERMLYYTGFTRHIGDVDDGDTVMDYMEQERDRGITITSAAISFDWKNHFINLIDTPGHVDFTLEVERSLRVMDGAVTILDASAGVEAQTVTVWRQAARYGVPRLAYLNKMDKGGADVHLCLQSIRDKLNVTPLLLQLPLGTEKAFTGVVDLVTMEVLRWVRGRPGDQYSRQPVGEAGDQQLHTDSVEAHNTLVENLADLDDTVAEYVLEDLPVPVPVLQAALRRLTLLQTILPVLCGSSYKNAGVQPLLDAVVTYLPSPLDRRYDFVHYYNKDLCALAFKIVHDQQRGALTFVRVYSGELGAGAGMYNVTRQCTERGGKLLQVSADEYREVHRVTAGNIAAIAGLKQTITGDTLTSSAAAANSARRAYRRTHALEEQQQQEERMDTEEDNEDEVDFESTPALAALSVPEPVFLCAIELHSLAQQRELDHALACLTREDPSLTVRVDGETGQTVLQGMGELHLEVIHERLRTEYKVKADLGPLQIAYREGIKSSVRHTLKLDQTLGNKRHRVTVCLSVHPVSDSEDADLVTVVADKESLLSTRVIRYQLKAVTSGVKAALSRGPILGFPVMQVRVELHDLVVGPGTSVPMITACTAQATSAALAQAESTLLEPTMSVVVHTNDDYIGRVMSDLTQRRSHIQEVEEEQEGWRTLVSTTPLSELRGYSTALRTLTSGTAHFTMHLSHYEPMSTYEQRHAVKEVTGFYPDTL